jgi:isopentenyl diphosphate isomerase/L-lactate dehydrogenase-like FMN-dependent dehydrogenase
MSGDLRNVDDFQRAAHARLDPGTLSYFAGGGGDEDTLAENLAALRRWRLRPRVLVDVSQVSTATVVLGQTVSMPLLVAPVAAQRVLHPGGEPAAARAAAAVGTAFCLSTFATASPSEVAAAAPGGIHWLQVYVLRDRAVTDALIEEALAAGFQALVVTADAPVPGLRESLRADFQLPEGLGGPLAEQSPGRSVAEQMLDRVDPSLSWEDVEQMAARWPVPVLVKGVLTAEDAERARRHGAAGVIVSNHGGRQLDGVNAAIDALPEVADAVGGRIEVLMDGGIRRGVDVLRALALGARAVLAGRAPVWGLTVAGEDGVRQVLELLEQEIAHDLALLGCRSPAEVNRAHVERR